MSIQRCILGTVVGGIVLFVLGYIIYGIAFASFFASNVGTATGVERQPFDLFTLAVGQFLWGGLLTMVLDWAGTTTMAQGAKIGAMMGLLFFLGMDLTLYATTNIANLTATLVDPILAAVLFAVAGAAVVPTLGKQS